MAGADDLLGHELFFVWYDASIALYGLPPLCEKGSHGQKCRKLK